MRKSYKSRFWLTLLYTKCLKKSSSLGKIFKLNQLPLRQKSPHLNYLKTNLQLIVLTKGKDLIFKIKLNIFNYYRIAIYTREPIVLYPLV
nr:MAG TPA: hypothetical protein [Caudoviricetes sp.]